MHEAGLRLPWERSAGPADGVGICLSGGGLRAASFSLGVVQALQAYSGLLFGLHAARYLSAVSGGSYVAAAHAINARALGSPARQTSDGAGRADGETPETSLPPLAPGSPEEQHILRHGRYLVDPIWPNLRGFLFRGFLNFLALVVLFVWVGTILADFAVVSTYVAAGPVWPAVTSLPFLVPVVALGVGIYVAVYGLYGNAVLARYGLPVMGLAVIVVFVDPVLAGLLERGWTANSNWWWVAGGVSLALLIATTLMGGVLKVLSVQGLPAAIDNWIQVSTVRLLGAVLMLWSGVTWYSLLWPLFYTETGSEAQGEGLLLFLGSLAAGLLFSYVPHRASLHRLYRDRIRSCFGVVRQGQTVAPDNPLLSELDGLHLTPTVLICATANVPNREPSNGRRAFAPFVFGPEACGVPGTLAAFETRKLELGRVPAGLFWGREPLVTLFTAVAATGAAASPSMGRYTLPSARPIVAAANIRLGRWIPNPFSARARRRVARRQVPGSFDRDNRLGPGYNELVPEMLGISGPQVYISDGGHFDNLGLQVLLQARCADIWCVDASPDKRGMATELRRVLRVAEDKLGIKASIDLDAFSTRPDGLYPTVFAHGNLDYGDGVTAVLHVVKLGVAPSTPQVLKEYRQEDRGFPHHGTPRQWYNEARMNAYRRLGYDSAMQALTVGQPER